MKHVPVFVILFVSLIIVGCASQQYRPKGDEEFYGTWANPDYPSFEYKDYPLLGVQKIVSSPDGTMETGSMFWDHRGAIRQYAYMITEKWTTSDGSIFYKQVWIEYFEYGGKRHEQGKFYLLCKISNSGKDVEFNSSLTDYPEQIDPDHRSYAIYYRQE